MAIQYTPTVTGTCGSNFFGSITLSISGGIEPYIIDWQSPNLGTDSGVTLSTRTGLGADEYFVRISDSTAPINEFIIVSIPVKDNVCCSIGDVKKSCGISTGSVTAYTSSSGSSYSYQLFTFDGQLLETIYSSDDIVEFSTISAGTYYIIATNLYGCSGSSETFVIESASDLNFGLYVVPNATCGINNLGKIYITGLTGNPPFSYLWSNGFTGTSITGLSEGSYSVQVTDGVGCTKVESTIVNSVEPIGLSLIVPTPPNCLQSDGFITYTFTGGTAPYYYVGSNGYAEISYSQIFTLNNLQGGTYTLTVTDAALCSVSTTYTLTNPTGMSSVQVFTKNTQCSSNNGSFTIIVEGGGFPYTYSLTYPDNNIESVTTDAKTNFFLDLSGGTYNIKVEDASGCTFSNDYNLITEQAFSIETTSTESTFGKNNGSISVIKTSGGTPPYNYILDGKSIFSNTIQSGVTFSNVTPGLHKIEVRDSLQCFETQQVFVESQPIVDFFLYYTTDGTNSGNTLNALISGGQPPFNFIWSDNISNNPQSIIATGLTAGTYSLTIIDSNNSSMKQNIVIPGSTNFVSYNIFTVGQQEFEQVDNTKYSLSKMMNEGYQDITSGNTGCTLTSAIFSAQVEVLPFGTITTKQFYTSTSLLTAPPDNIWYDAIKSLLTEVIGVQDVVIDESENTLLIKSDRSRSVIIDGTYTAINLKVYLLIDYDINCKG